MKRMLMVGLILAAQGQGAVQKRLVCHGREGDTWTGKNHFVFLDYTMAGDPDFGQRAVAASGTLRVVTSGGFSALSEKSGTFTGTITPRRWYGGLLGGQVSIPNEPTGSFRLLRDLGRGSSNFVPGGVILFCLDERVTSAH